MPRLIWTPSALIDVQRLHHFLSEKNPDSAKRAIGAIRVGVRFVARQPEIGRPIVDMDPEFREWPIDFGNSVYVVLYRYDARAVAMLAVRHQREVGY